MAYTGVAGSRGGNGNGAVMHGSELRTSQKVPKTGRWAGGTKGRPWASATTATTESGGCWLGWGWTWAVAEVMAAAMLDHVRTAHAKGLSGRQVVLRHVLRNAAIPIVTVIGLQLGLLLSGAVLTETIFALPGVGRLMVDSILSRDYSVVQAGALFIAITFVLVNLLVDLSYTLLDPRVGRR